MPADPDPTGNAAASTGDDPFVATLHWLRQQLGSDGTALSVADLATRSGTNERTLRNWLDGNYPRRRTSTAVLDLHLWAIREVPGYPPETGPLTGLARAFDTEQPDTDGHAGTDVDAAEDLTDSVTELDETTNETTRPKARGLTAKHAWLAAGLAAVAAVAVVAVGLLAGWWSNTTPARNASANPDVSSSSSSARGLGGDTPTVSETAANHQGSPVYKNPEGDTVGANVPARIDFGKVVQVVCYAPNRTGQGSVTALYLLRGGTWDGLYAVSDTFTNGDPLGSAGPTNLDPHVPACP